MIKKILKQMWVQRKENGWIFLEMAIISFFLWKAMDPIYTIVTMHNFNKGFNTEKALAINMEISMDKGTKEELDGMAEAIKLNPMVQDAAITGVFTFPGATARALYSIKSEKCPEWIGMITYTGFANYAQNYMNIVGYKDISTGMPPVIDAGIPVETICYISRMAAAKLFPDGSNPVGQKVTRGGGLSFTVAGVIEDVTASFGIYEPVIIWFDEPLSGEYSVNIILKLKENADEVLFKKSFMENEAAKLSTEKCKIRGVKSFGDIYTENRIMIGVDGQMRLQYILSFFFIACAFLGIAGTLWMKCNRRRSEIGLYRAMGSTKRGILGMFFSESAILVTLAYVVALVPLAAIILGSNEFLYSNMMFDLSIDNTSPYLYKRFVPHFAIVSLVTYAILMGTAFIGTYITVHKYSNIQPSEALRDE